MFKRGLILICQVDNHTKWNGMQIKPKEAPACLCLIDELIEGIASIGILDLFVCKRSSFYKIMI